MRDGIVSTDTICFIDVKGTHALLLGDFEQVGSIGGIPSADDEDEVKIEFIGVLDEIVDCVLPLLSFHF